MRRIIKLHLPTLSLLNMFNCRLINSFCFLAVMVVVVVLTVPGSLLEFGVNLLLLIFQQ